MRLYLRATSLVLWLSIQWLVCSCFSATSSSSSSSSRDIMMTTSDGANKRKSQQMSYFNSLAGPYLIQGTASPATRQYRWCVIPIDGITSIDRNAFSSKGGQAWSALHTSPAQQLDDNDDDDDSTSLRFPMLQATVDTETRCCAVALDNRADDDDSSAVDADFVAILSRVFCQWAISQQCEHDNVHTNADGRSEEEWTIRLPDEKGQMQI